MSVKMIFKVLIGTMVAIVMYSCCVELFNVNISGMQVKQACNMAAKQSTELFTQETYKEATNTTDGLKSRSTKMKDIKTSGGDVYVSGDFYNGKTSTQDIWNMLYASSSSTFKKVCDMTESGEVVTKFNGKNVTYSIDADRGVKFDNKYFSKAKSVASIYRELDELYGGLYKSSSVSRLSTTLTWNQFMGASSNTIDKSAVAANASAMRNNLYTPVNIGFPYFDPIVTNKMFQWDLAMILSNGDKDSLQKEKDSTGSERYFINYKGFRCYANEARITNFKYYVIDTTTTSGKNKLKNMIDMDTDSITKIGGRENNYVAVIGLEYEIPMAYEGITPIAKVFEYTWNKQVRGRDMNNDSKDDNTVITDTTHKSWSFNTSKMTNKATDKDGDANGAIATTGELYYVLTR